MTDNNIVNGNLLNILLIEDNPGDVRLVREMLGEVQDFSFNLGCADKLSVGLEYLDRGGIDVVLLDLSLPDSQGLGTFVKVKAQAPSVPIVIMSGLAAEAVAAEAVKNGAQDYLIKGQMDSSNFLVRSMRYAVERNRHIMEMSKIQEELRALSFTDDLTGLNNRRSFLALADQQLKLAKRTKSAAFLMFVDLDDMKWINDNLGHQVGDCALKETAEVLRETFRESDVIARVGGDEFAVFATEVPGDREEVIITRLLERLDLHNAQRNSGQEYELSLSMGLACCEPDRPCTIFELMDRADVLMYEHKRRKRNH